LLEGTSDDCFVHAGVVVLGVGLEDGLGGGGEGAAKGFKLWILF